SRRRHTRLVSDWSSDVCSSDLQDQRPVADQVLQPKQIAAKLFWVVQVDVERHEVEERQVQVLGGGVVGVRDQAVRVGLLGHVPRSEERRVGKEWGVGWGGGA